MKKIISIFVMLVCFYSNYTFANHQLAILKIKVQQCFPLQVYIDGQYAGIFQSQFETRNLQAGQHYVQLIRRSNKHQNSRVVYASTLNLWPQHITIARFSTQYGLDIERKPLYAPPTCNNYNNTCNNLYYDNTCEPIMPQAVCAQQFNQFLSVVRSSWFDASKKELIVNFLNQNYLYASQVKCLLQTLDFESTRIYVAKQAYAKTIDRPNYYLVFDSFDFESSKVELSNFMQNN